MDKQKHYTLIDTGRMLMSDKDILKSSLKSPILSENSQCIREDTPSAWSQVFFYCL